MIGESGERRAKSGESRVATQHTAHPNTLRSSIRIPQSAIRNGLTLIELLISITIIATLAAVFLGVSNAAMESARSARTKTTIGKIHTLLMERWDSYATRRVELNPALKRSIDRLSGDIRGPILSDARLLATRELMKYELPDRWSDITTALRTDDPDLDGYPGPDLLATTPAIARFYRRQYERVRNSSELTTNQRAECLFMIVMYHTGDGEARTLFSSQDIGDTDGDGAEEFLDGWGRPIFFIRWPAGFVAASDLMTGDANADHDPFDYFRRDAEDAITPSVPNDPVFDIFEDHIGIVRTRNQTDEVSAYRLMPLVYSNGNDGSAGIVQLGPDVGNSLDPYQRYPVDGDPNSPRLVGAYRSEEALDNIHNHLLDGS